MPLHVGSPIAHPAAPSHVSGAHVRSDDQAGNLRDPARGARMARSRSPVVGRGAAARGHGVGAQGRPLCSRVERDIKRLLAFSSIENVGIVLIGVGAGMVFHASGLISWRCSPSLPGSTTRANHAAFKALLFLERARWCTPSARATWRRCGRARQAHALDRGHLPEWLRRHRRAAPAQWLRERMAHPFRRCSRPSRIPRLELSLVFALAIAGLAATGGLAVACFVRAFGITFLALPRSERRRAGPRDGPGGTRGPGHPRPACAVLGPGPTMVLPVLGGAAATLVGLAGAGAGGVAAHPHRGR